MSDPMTLLNCPGAARTGPVLHHELLSQHLRLLVRNDDNVGPAAGPEPDQDANRLVRPVLRLGHRKLRALQRKRGSWPTTKLHHWPPWSFIVRHSANAFRRRLGTRVTLLTTCATKV